MSSALSATVDALPVWSDLEQRWRALEARSVASFFTSWTWIGTWLKHLPSALDCRLLTARRGGNCVGLAIVVAGPVRFRGGVPLCGTWYLHATGRPEYDTLTIEHNDFLLDRACEPEARRAMLAAWLSLSRGSTELHLPGVPTGRFGEEVVRPVVPRWRRLGCDRTGYAIDLQAVRDAQGDGVMLLGSKSRGKLRRNLREYQATLGEVRLSAARDSVEALKWFAHLVDLHQAHWIGKGQPGAFASDWVRQFHQGLISEGLPRGEVQLHRVQAGEVVVALLYSFVFRGRAYFYQGGLDYGLVAEKFAQPGLIGHVLAAQHLAEQGLDVYDFMVGDSRYKEQLSNRRETQTWVVLQSPSLRLQVEDWLRRWKRGAHVPAPAEAESGD